MNQKTLDGKTDCRKTRTKGSCTVRFTGNNPEIMEGLQRVHEKYPCVKIRVNGKILEEEPVEWDKGKETPHA